MKQRKVLHLQTQHVLAGKDNFLHWILGRFLRLSSQVVLNTRSCNNKIGVLFHCFKLMMNKKIFIASHRHQSCFAYQPS